MILFPTIFIGFLVIFILNFAGSFLGEGFKKIVKIINYGYITIFILCFVIGFVGIAFEASKNPVKVSSTTPKSNPNYPGFTIENYQIDMKVSVDNKVDVKETILVNWTETNHHGILKFIPRWLKYTSKNNDTIKRKSKVLNLRSELEDYEIDTVNKKSRIKIGNADEYVNLGYHKYDISYTYDMGKDPFNGFDEFIFHTIGDYWYTPIKNYTINVEMPKNIDEYSVHFFLDKYRKKEITNDLFYYVNDNKLTVSGNKTINKSLTIDIELPEGYFVGGSYNYTNISMLIAIFIILAAVLIIFWFIKHGKNYKNVPRVLEFYAPDGLDAAEVGYIYKKSLNKKLVISLLVSLANKKYIRIDQDDKDYTVTNLLPYAVKENVLARKVVLKKTKDADDTLSKSESNFLEKLSVYTDTTLDSGFTTYDKIKEKLVNGGFIQIIYDNKEEVDKSEKKVQALYEKEKERVLNATKGLVGLTDNENILYEKLFSEKHDVIKISEHKTLYKAFYEIYENIKKKVSEQVTDTKSFKYKIAAFCICIVMFILWIINYAVIEDLDPRYSILYAISAIAILTSFVFSIFMGRNTVYGEQIKARVLGFRKFLEVAEKDQLNAMVEKNPNYFFDILPYTYVLNISKKWIKKFEGVIDLRDDMGNFDYTSIDNFSSISDSFYIPHSSGSSSSCGGGCSSCGGGGSW